MRFYSFVAKFLPLILAATYLSNAHGQLLRLVTPEEVGVSSQRIGRLDQITQEAISQKKFPGAVILVARKGGIVYRKAFGYRMHAPKMVPLTVDTIFDIASLTKIIPTAICIMILVEEGRISLSDPVSKYLNRFSQYGKHRVMIRQLLTHYSGLRPDLDLDSPWSGYKTAISRAYRERLKSSPGKRFIYSDINYLILGELVRQVSGQHLDEFSRDRLFDPMGMHDTFFKPPFRLKHRIAPTQLRQGKLLHGEVHDPTASRMGGCAGHAGAFSTVDDVARYAQMILNDGAYDGKRILAPLSVLQMTTAQSPPGEKVIRGLGFDIRSPFQAPRGDLFPIGSFGHSGFTGTSLWIDPYTETFVVLFTSRLYPDGKGNAISFRKQVASVVGASIIDRVSSQAIRSALWNGPAS